MMLKFIGSLLHVACFIAVSIIVVVLAIALYDGDANTMWQWGIVTFGGALLLYRIWFIPPRQETTDE